MMMFAFLRLPSLLIALAASTAAEYIVKGEDTFYPYAIHKPGGDLPKPWPVLVFLPGSGVGIGQNPVGERAGYNGFGSLVYSYDHGNQDELHKLVGEQFLTVVPVTREFDPVTKKPLRHIRSPELKRIIDEVRAEYEIEDKLSISGYSMGARGVWRFITDYPELINAAHPVAGAAEKEDDSFIVEEPAEPTFPRIDGRLANIPVWAFASESDKDDTEGHGGERTQECMDRLKHEGNTLSKATIFTKDKEIGHGKLSGLAFTSEILKWMLDARNNTDTKTKETGTKALEVKTTKAAEPKTTLATSTKISLSETAGSVANLETPPVVTAKEPKVDAPATASDESKTVAQDETAEMPQTVEGVEGPYGGITWERYKDSGHLSLLLYIPIVALLVCTCLAGRRFVRNFRRY